VKQDIPMNDMTRLLAIVLALGCGQAALAQDETAPTEEVVPPADGTAEAPAAEPTEEPATEPVPDPLGLSTGTVEGAEDPAADGPGSMYVEATHGDWEQRCFRTEDGSDPCQLYQLLKDAEGNNVAEISMFDLPAESGEAVAGASIIAPLETLLTENLRLKIDTGDTKVYPFTWCAGIGCVARVGFTAAEIAQFKAGAKAVITIVPVVAPDQKVEVNLSLKGFTAGYDAMVAANVGDTTPPPPVNE
jgi:invasion protein IalB